MYRPASFLEIFPPIPPGSSCQQLGLATPAHLPEALRCLRRLGPGGDARRSSDPPVFLGNI